MVSANHQSSHDTSMGDRPSEPRPFERSLLNLATIAIASETEERRQLASDLHDDVGQLLSLASIRARSLAAQAKGAHAQEFNDLSALLSTARERITTLSFELSPPLLDDDCFVATARWLAENLGRRYHLSIRVTGDPDLQLDETTGTALFRGMRELLINVAKHAGCGRADVRIRRDGPWVSVVVEDRGIGIPASRRQGFGLCALRQRMLQLGGHLEIGTRFDGRGTRIEMRLRHSTSNGGGPQ